ncbi:MAG: penicillin-binding transpeptidase domain-containing protein [Verrucomicrobiota bacterium]
MKFALIIAGICFVELAYCQTSQTTVAASPDAAVKLAESLAAKKSASEGSFLNRKDARVISLKIPAPRGQIVDRTGEPFAQNEVAYQVALQYQQFQNVDRSYVIEWARTRMNKLNGVIEITYPKTDDELYGHYKDRRWLPLYITRMLSEGEAKKIESKLPAGIILSPVYRRTYPHKGLGAHIIGYAGSVGKLPTGPINFNEPLWEESEGRAGFEKLFNEQLTGVDGMKRLLFDENGNKLLEEQVTRPRPGGTVVTTLNLKWQKLAEEVLAKGCERGAFVVIDVVTGEVLVMASRPTFDLNRFIPGISGDEFQALQDDPATPLFGRAFQSAYPPASAYKPLVALAALDTGIVDENKLIDSPASITIGNHTFNNWTKIPEGPIDVRRAIARSCNTWFYQVGIDTGASVFLNLSKRMGMGEKSDLPLIGETPGLVPTNEWMFKNEGRKILNGDTANMSIGQGSLLASPLQVAQMMAGIGNGAALPKLSLISQVQDTRGRVVQAMRPERKHWLGVNYHAVEVVREGMRDVVSKGYGTGRSGNLTFTTLAGKTGTAQWGPPKLNQRLAWFAGFLPHDNPRYAFAVLYEGKPGQKVSGGRMAAPMVRNFFEPLKDEIKEIIEPPKRAVVVIAEGENGIPAIGAPGEGEILKALPIDESETVPSEPEEVLRAVPVEEEFIVDDDEVE